MFKYENQGVATLEDGLYVLEQRLEDAAFRDKMVRFVRASMKGWKWAEDNPRQAALIVLDYDETGAQTEKHQVRMMGEIAKLTAGSNGSLSPRDYERTVASLLSGGSDPVITKKPSGAWTHIITDKALALDAEGGAVHVNFAPPLNSRPRRRAVPVALPYPAEGSASGIGVSPNSSGS